eukprot:Pgem_evm1s11474
MSVIPPVCVHVCKTLFISLTIPNFPHSHFHKGKIDLVEHQELKKSSKCKNYYSKMHINWMI